MTLSAETDRRFLLAPIVGMEDAQAWIKELQAADMVFHFEDDPAEIINCHTDQPLFAPEEVPHVRDRVRELYEQDWGEHECPIGYALFLMNPNWREE